MNTSTKNTETIQAGKQAIIQKYGPWTSHNIHLGGDVYTMDGENRPTGESIKRFVQIVADLARKPLNELRIVDLGCLEGLFAIEFAQHGAQVVGIEGREINLEKARFAKDMLGLDNLELVQDDVRNLTVEKYGKFDVILCFGILYHINAPDVFDFVRNMAETCTNLLLIHSEVSLIQQVSYNYQGHQYWGRGYTEHLAGMTAEDKKKRLFASLDNDISFWFTKPSLVNFLTQSGFTSVFDNLHPKPLAQFDDQVSLAAIKGTPQTIISNPVANTLSRNVYPETQARRMHPSQRYPEFILNLYERTPAPIKQILRKLRGR